MNRPAQRFLLAACAAFLLSGCGNMKRQRYARTDSPAPQLPRGTSAQLPPAHTVPHRAQPVDATFATGAEPTGQFVTKLPVPLSAALLIRGQQRFSIYCSVCHGDDGQGRGIVVRRGFPAPPSLTEPRLREAAIGYLVNVMLRGHGVMYSYADRLDAPDRWAVAAYVRTLQFSRAAPVATLSDADRAHLASP
jgi:mono/diheme cytochrome c family protein